MLCEEKYKRESKFEIKNQILTCYEKIRTQEGGFMNPFLTNVDQRIAELKQIIAEKEGALSEAQEGVINVARSGERIQYYYKRNPVDSQRSYLKTAQLPLVKALCQKDYDQKVLQAAQKELKLLEKFAASYPKHQYEDIYESLNEDRRKYVNPIILPDDQFIKIWQEKEYQKKGFRDAAPEYYTNNGERVRSKTEILIANALDKHNIPYRYKCPLYLNGYGTIHPDFTVLNVRLRKEFFWEHMGMMDDPEYSKEALQRITMYEKNNMFPGKQLILTHETSKSPINSKLIEKMIIQYLK